MESLCPTIKLLDSQLASAIIGGLIGGIFTYVAVRMTIRHERKTSQSAEDAEVKAICSAIETEMHCLVERYEESIGKSLMECKSGSPFLFFYPVDQEYFAVFHANTAWIGKIKSEETRRRVVVAYIAMKGLIDSYKHNNQMLMNYEAFVQQAATLPQVGGVQQHYQNELQKGHLNQLVEYVPVLKESHADTLSKTSSALASLRGYLATL